MLKALYCIGGGEIKKLMAENLIAEMKVNQNYVHCETNKVIEIYFDSLSQILNKIVY